jgi:E3 ubiquitin-protein ligase HERC2
MEFFCFQCPRLVEGLADKCVVQLASHPDSKHFLVLTSSGEVFSWGCGDGGRLGHGDTYSQEEPTLIEALLGQTIVFVAVGNTYRYCLRTPHWLRFPPILLFLAVLP